MMQKKLNQLLICLSMTTLFSPLAFSDEIDTQNYTLEKVIVLSRHGIRAPLATGGSALAKVTPNSWPTWDAPGSYLTNRGGVLESYFGKYFSTWLEKTNLIKKDPCPTDKDVYVYANARQRTIATGQFFIVGAYPGCDIVVNHNPELNKTDPVFNLTVTDGSDEFKKQLLSAINTQVETAKLKEVLKPSYALAEAIVDYDHSESCKPASDCDLSEVPTEFSISLNKQPGVNGPLQTGNLIADAVILQYYEGFPMEQVGWGKIKNSEDWKALIEIKNWYTDVLFATPLVAKHISKSLISHMNSMWDNKNSAKFNFLVGHDSNIASVLSALDVKAYQLPEQYEKTPIGGKIVFQRWIDNKTNKPLMKIEYIYQTAEQLRNLQVLNDANQPKLVTLEMKECPIDKQGFCEWDKFKNVLDGLSK